MQSFAANTPTQFVRSNFRFQFRLNSNLFPVRTVIYVPVLLSISPVYETDDSQILATFPLVSKPLPVTGQENTSHHLQTNSAVGISHAYYLQQ